MLYEIVHEQPCRIRLRCGKYIFDEDEMRGVSLALLDIEGVSKAVVHPANGSILVEHDGTAREKVLQMLDSFDVLDLPKAVEDAAVDTVELDNRFATSLIETVAGRCFRKFLLPPIIRNTLIVLNLFRYIYKGIRCLLRGHLAVEVLDATALTVSVVTGDFNTASSVMFLLSISDLLSEYTEARTRSAMRENMSICAEKVWVMDGDVELETPIEQVKAGDIVKIRTGSYVPLDGTVVSGEAEVNESSMTGESALVHKGEGSTLYAGTVVDEGCVLMEASATAGQSRIDHIVDMVEESQELKASAQSHAEQLAESMVPVSLGVFIADLVITRDLRRAMSVLMVDYSCAIKLSIPVAVMSAMREATRRKAVVKGGKYLEALASADTIVFDKTGTLTNAQPEVEKVISLNGFDEEHLLKHAACLEEHFPHSVARAIVRAAKERGIDHSKELHAEVEYIVSHGIVSKIDDKRICIGSAHFIFEDEEVPKPNGLDEQLADEVAASSTVYVSYNHELVGVICISDPIREEAASVVTALHDEGVERVVMLTGDSENCAAHAAAELGISEYRSQVLPEDKAAYVEKLKDEGCTVAMVGDGINDSPALAASDVSIALADASDIARAVADVSIVDSSLMVIVDMRRLSRKLMKRIDRSYRFIVTFNTALIVLGIVGVLPPATAALLHNGSTMLLTAFNTRPFLD